MSPRLYIDLRVFGGVLLFLLPLLSKIQVTESTSEIPINNAGNFSDLSQIGSTVRGEWKWSNDDDDDDALHGPVQDSRQMGK